MHMGYIKRNEIIYTDVVRVELEEKFNFKGGFSFCKKMHGGCHDIEGTGVVF